ncbi:MAG: clostripain-related cysteine peptidase, partial [Clostridia bacterium]|nr:clostripain-related cysteine peptidase [Clostridia bacterium]
MQRVPGTGGRRKRVTSGGGNAYRRGDGLGSGPVGGGFGGGSSSGRSGAQRGAGTSLLPLLLGLLLSSSGNGGGGKKKFSLKRILIIAALLFVGYLLLQRCSAQSALFDPGAYEDAAYSATSAPLVTATDAPAAQSLSQSSDKPDYSVSNKARSRYTTLKGNGEDTFTIMVYMCGADLESNYGMATSDLNEMLHATLSDNVKVIVETGGAKRWKNSIISNKTNQIYEVRDDGIKCLEKDLGRSAMTSASTLTHFIRYAVDTFPANRYALIMWDHGGGSLTGYGYDELYPGGSMALDQVEKALSDAGCKFDFIGFDACLMANYETAIVAERYADYLIASEETEPGSGWYYTDWLTELSRNPSMSTVDLGKSIVDDFTAASQRQAAGSPTTLSIIDLAQMAGTVPEAFNEFAKDTSSLLDSDNYETISDARSDAREFARSTQINQIDLIDLCDRIDTDASKNLADALRDCVKYNRYSKGMSNSNGI